MPVERNSNSSLYIVITVIVGLMMFSLGFGSSQLAVSKDVTRNNARLESLEKTTIELKEADRELKSDLRELMANMQELIKKLPEPK